METIECTMLILNDGRPAFKYPHTEPLWDMEGFYFLAEDGMPPIKLLPEQVERLVPFEYLQVGK
jgi:hypothetical protein